MARGRVEGDTHRSSQPLDRSMVNAIEALAAKRWNYMANRWWPGEGPDEVRDNVILIRHSKSSFNVRFKDQRSVQGGRDQRPVTSRPVHQAGLRGHATGKWHVCAVYRMR